MEFALSATHYRKLHGGVDELIDDVKKSQEYASYRHRVRRTKLGPSDEVTFAVVDDNGALRYELIVVDNDDEDPSNSSVGVFIVPRGM